MMNTQTFVSFELRWIRINVIFFENKMILTIVFVIVLVIIATTVIVGVLVGMNMESIISRGMFPGSSMNDLLSIPSRHILSRHSQASSSSTLNTDPSSVSIGTHYTVNGYISCYTTVEPTRWYASNRDNNVVHLSNKKTTLLILLSHGNAGSITTGWRDVIDRMVNVAHFACDGVDHEVEVFGVVYDYLGYNGEKGQATPTNAIDDCVAVYDDVLKRYSGVTHVMHYGRSIGAAVTVHATGKIMDRTILVAAAEHTPSSVVHIERAVFLETPFLGLATTRVLGSNLVRDRFPCAARLRQLRRSKIDCTVVLAERDSIIDNATVTKLLQQSVGPTLTLETIVGAQHNTAKCGSRDPSTGGVVFRQSLRTLLLVK
jgi:hypothetical protein